MPSNKIEFTVFISSPSDLDEERKIVTEVIGQINKVRSKIDGARLEPLMWEDTLPEFGSPPQDTLNANMGNEYDIFIGIMGNRFGTPTENAGSGSEEEFNLAYSRKQENPQSVEIIYYFRKPEFSGMSLNAHELVKVQDFQNSLQGKGIYEKFATTDEFKTMVHVHLSMLFQRCLDKINTEEAVEESQENGQSKSNSLPAIIDPLEALKQLEIEEEDELGFHELSEEFESITHSISSALEELNQEMVRLSDRTNAKTKEITSSGGEGNSKRFFSDISIIMDNYVSNVAPKLPDVQVLLDQLIDNSRQFIDIINTENVGSDAEVATLKEQMFSMCSSMNDAYISYEQLAQTIGGIPRLSTKIGRSKKRLKIVVVSFAKLLEVTKNQLSLIVNTL